MNKTKIKLVIFDMAGTSVHDKNYVAKLFVKTFSEFGIHIRIGEVNAVMGLEKKKAITALLKNHIVGKVDKVLISKMHKCFIRYAIAFYQGKAKPKPFAIQLFKKLKKENIVIALNSGFDRPIMNCIITTLRWQNYIDFSVASDEVREGRPMPYMIKKIMNKAKIKDPLAVAKVGDTPVDLLEGFNAATGLNIAIVSDKYTDAVLSCYPHTHLIKNLKELLGIIQTYPAF